MQSNYVVVFDLAHEGYRQWWFPAFGLIFIFLGSLFVFMPRLTQRILPGGLQGTARRVFSWFWLSFAVLWTVGSFLGTYLQYSTLSRAEREGNLRVVEGRVSNFHPMPYTGHAMESFEVNGVRFSYSDYVVTAGFNNTASHGGPIRDGLPVRISYVGNTILRLEIGADSLPSLDQRLAYSNSQKVQSAHLEQASPTTNQMNLGFAIAAVFMSLVWNIDWTHYIRYWKKSGPPYGRYWEYGFRAFFLLCLVGSLWGLGREIANTRRSAHDYSLSLLDGLTIIGLFAAADAFFRWRLRRLKARSTG